MTQKVGFGKINKMFEIEWSVQYIISQVFVVFAMIFSGRTYHIKNKVEILLLNIFSCLCFVAEYALIGAWTGALMNFILTVSTVWLYFENKNKIKNRYTSIISIMILLIFAGVFTYQNWFSIISIVATTIFIYAAWQNNYKVYRWISFISNSLWVWYNVLIKSLLGIIAECILLIIAIVGVVRIYKKGEAKNAIY